MSSLVILWVELSYYRSTLEQHHVRYRWSCRYISCSVAIYMRIACYVSRCAKIAEMFFYRCDVKAFYCHNCIQHERKFFDSKNGDVWLENYQN